MNPNILHWSYRDFREFPNDLIEHCDTLDEVYLKENFIPTLPKWLFQFVHLKFIQLSGNVLETIPCEIGELINLEYFDVSNNKLTKLPKQIYQLNKLQFLNLCDNGIYSLDRGKSIKNKFTNEHIERIFIKIDIGSMKSLKTLNIEKNRLTEIPLELATSDSLTELFLNDNDLVEIPTKIMSMKSLKVLEAESEFLT